MSDNNETVSHQQATEPATASADAEAHPNNVPDLEVFIEAGEEDDDSEDDARSLPSSSTSVTSSVFQYRVENGRTYHSYKDGKYPLPNDEREQDRLDLQHNMFLLSFDDKLGTAPPNEPGAKVGRVLDVGTGTGIWAVDFGDAHPEAEILGVDLSAIQPEYTPPNVKFEIDDIEEEWLFSRPFDYIHSRIMNSAIRDWRKFIQNSYDNLTPGGYLELVEMDLQLKSDDGTLKPEHSIMKTLGLLAEAAQKLGAAYQDPKELKPMMIQAGFTDVVMQQLKWPTSPWPKEKRYKNLGYWGGENIEAGWEAVCMAPLTRALGWSREEVLVLLAQNRQDFRNRDIHSYFSIWAMYGRKPEKEESA
ncbi:Secondary metabolism regulator LAE1 [Colletotrichum aenigma]|uniref:Secondary metabolism regulator LAE1 n=1 Tax=Colletotrichum aenigma TaxID=1215731 RepID=UPI0018731CC5|nr:Secondary metabolism regulator LAE1 [Colletotrichum aenigma]KAF5524509.1 Secondary metabolism regulator LAE1 [Colletotrichum aenigma]